MQAPYEFVKEQKNLIEDCFKNNLIKAIRIKGEIGFHVR